MRRTSFRWHDQSRLSPTNIRLRRGAFAVLVVRHVRLPVVLAAASQDGRRRQATRRGAGATAGDAASDAVAAEARDLVRRAVGDAAGLSVKAQLRQAARHHGYGPEDWRVREAWYGRAGSWSAAALDDLRRRRAAWSEQDGDSHGDQSALAQRIRRLRVGLDTLAREVAAIEAEIARLLGGGA